MKIKMLLALCILVPGILILVACSPSQPEAIGEDNASETQPIDAGNEQNPGTPTMAETDDPFGLTMVSNQTQNAVHQETVNAMATNIALTPSNTPPPSKTPGPTRTPTLTLTPYPTPVPPIVINGAEMVLVPAGLFDMGGEGQFDEFSKPVHSVFLDDYYIDRFEVTNAQYVRFLNEMGNQEEGGVTWLDLDSTVGQIIQTESEWQVAEGFDNHPIVGVSWFSANAFCDWRGARLPTEAEWEKAARGTDQRLFPWGNEERDETRLNSALRNGGTVEVGSYPAGVSPYGVFDMAGNAAEWVADWFDLDYYATLPDGVENPQGPSSGDFRILRGGDWGFGSNHTAFRNFGPPQIRSDDIGFRCAVTSP